MTGAGADEQGLVRTLVAMSRDYGSDPSLVLGGGGNTSLKLGERLLVKASGAALGDIVPEGFVELDRRALQALVEGNFASSREEREQAFKEALMGARRHPERGQRPSVESVLHHLVPGRFVVHLHATLVNRFSCARDGRRLIEGDLGGEALWVGLVDPGIALAKALGSRLAEFQARTGGSSPRAVVLQNHGLVTGGDSAEEVDDNLAWLFEALREILARESKGGAPEVRPTAEAPERPAGANTALAAASIAILSATGAVARKVSFEGSAKVLSFLANPRSRELALGGPLTPDQIVYCRSFPLWVDVAGDESPQALADRLEAEAHRYKERHGTSPVVFLVPGLGMFACGATDETARTASLVYADAMKVMTGAEELGGVHFLPDDFREFIEHWEVESYRRSVSGHS